MLRKTKQWLAAILTIVLLFGTAPSVAAESHDHAQCDHEFELVHVVNEEEHIHDETCEHEDHIHDENCIHDNEESPPIEDGPPAATEDPAEEQPEDQEEPSDQPEAQPDDTAAEAEKQAAYDEFFSEKRPFEDEYKTQDGFNLKFGEDGKLYTLDASGKERLLIDALIAEAVKIDNGIVYIQDNSLVVMADRNIKNQTILYKGETVSCLYANSELIFFTDGPNVYRYHIESETLDLFFEQEGVQYVRAISSEEIYFGLPNPEYQAIYDKIGDAALDSGIQRSLFHYYNAETGELREASLSEIRGEQQATASSNSYTIPGASVSLPLDDYGSSGTYFNRRYTATNTYTLAEDTDKDIPGVVACTEHDEGAGISCRYYEDSWQCAAFAKYVYDKLWPNKTWTQSYNRSIGAGQNYATFSQIPSGSYVLLADNTGGSGSTHSVVFVECDANGVVVYEANYSNQSCNVRLAYVTYAQLAYSYVVRYVHPNIPAPHTHTWGEWQSDGSTHWKQCTITNCIETSDEASHSGGSWQPNGSLHYKSCAVCGEGYGYTGHSYTAGYETYDMSQHKKTCVCGAYTLESHGTSQYTASGSAGHYRKCTICNGATTATTAHSYTLTNGGASGHYNKCNTCGYTTTTSAHSFGSWSATSTTNHSRSCVCGRVESGGHNSSNFSYDSSYHYYRCSICNFTVSTSTHNSSSVTYDTGTHYYRCSICGILRSSGGHSYGSYYYLNGSYHARKCSCGYTVQYYHSYNAWRVYTTSQHYRWCTVCSNAYQYGSHTWGTPYYSGGKRYQKCTVCGTVKLLGG